MKTLYSQGATGETEASGNKNPRFRASAACETPPRADEFPMFDCKTRPPICFDPNAV